MKYQQTFIEYRDVYIVFSFKSAGLLVSMYDSDKQLIHEESGGDLLSLNLIKDIDFERARELKSAVVCFDRFTGGNMCHVAFDHITRGVEFEQDDDCTRLFLDNSWAWSKLFIESIFSDFQYLEELDLIKIKRCFIHSKQFKGKFDHPLVCLSEKSLNSLRKVTSTNENIFNYQGQPENIYLTRRGEGARSLEFESSLELFFQNRGFLVVECSTLSPTEQLSIFRGAKIIVGLHGAGLSNIISMRHGHLYELFNDTGTQAYARLANTLNLGYSRIDIQNMSESKCLNLLNETFTQLPESPLTLYSVLSREASIRQYELKKLQKGLDSQVNNIRDLVVQNKGTSLESKISLLQFLSSIRPDGQVISKKLEELNIEKTKADHSSQREDQ